MNKKSFLYKKYLWWKYEGRYIISDFIKGIKNIVKWFPIIWKDRDYDHSYTLNLLKNKLIFQSNYFENHSYHTDSVRDIQIMRTCIKLIDKINEDFYHMEYLNYHKSNFNFIDIDKKGSKEVKIDLVYENFDEYFSKYKLIYKKISKELSTNDKFTIAKKISFENQKRCKKILFQLLENNIEKWWS